MPSLSLPRCDKKGGDSAICRQRLPPFSNTTLSVAEGKRRVRTDNTVVVKEFAANSRLSKGSSPVVYSQHVTETSKSRHDRCKQPYLATSPDQEQRTLNVALLNARKWLKKKNECLKQLRQPPGEPQVSYPTAEQETLLKELVAEASKEQEEVDILLDRGHNYQRHHACTALDLELENFEYLWNTYKTQLFHIYEPEKSFTLPLEHSVLQSDGKENLASKRTSLKKNEILKSENKKKYDSCNTVCNREKTTPLSISGVKHNHRCKTPPKKECTSSDIFDRKKLTTTQQSSATHNGKIHCLNNRRQRTPTQKESKSLDNISDKKKISATTQPDLTTSQPDLKFIKGKTPVQDLDLKTIISRLVEKDNRQTSFSSAKSLLQSAVVKGKLEAGKKQTRLNQSASDEKRIVTATPWTEKGHHSAGWLKVAGEGFFTHLSPPQQRGKRIVTSSTHRPFSELQTLTDNPLTPKQLQQFSGLQLITTHASTLPGVHTKSVHRLQGVRQVDNLCCKQSKELNNEHEQKVWQLRQDGTGQEEVAAQKTSLRVSSNCTTMEMEADAIELNRSLLESSCGESHLDLSLSMLDDSTASITDARALADENDDRDGTDADLPTEPKRRRMNLDTQSSFSSCSGSPFVSENSSLNGTPCSSPMGTMRRACDFRQRYRKDELWKAIESNYQYLMDKEIIEACQSTESDLSYDEDDFVPNVSFTEFLQKYQELIDWLNKVQINTKRVVTSLSEKYLNQSFHEEMLEKSSQREFLNRYAHQLLLRYPNLQEQVQSRIQRLNHQWQAMETMVKPKKDFNSMESMIQDLECDLAALRRWLNAIESCLMPMTIRADWTDTELEERLKHHQLLQQDIESRSKTVSAVLRLSEQLEQDREACTCNEETKSLQLVALNLQRRWHGIWLQSLEWQCRLEEAVNRRKGLYGTGFNFSGFTLPILDEAYGASSDLDLQTDNEILNNSNGSLIELSDDSLLFIGTRSEHHLGDTSSPSGPLSPDATSLTHFLDRSSGDSANISEAESRMGDSLLDLSHNRNDLLSTSSDGEGHLHVLKVGQEPKDIGYSSESQSNDEIETMHQQIALEYRYAGMCEVASDSPLGEKMAIPQPNGVHQDYYCMTIIELDSTDKTTDDGNTTDDKQSPKHSLPLMKDDEALSGTGEVLRRSGSGSHEDITVKSWLESSDDSELISGLPALEPMPDSALHFFTSLSESDSATESKEKIKYLIEHAEDLVKTPARTLAPGSPERRTSPSKQTQTVCTLTNSIESSCDASGEETSDDSDTEDFSTATDDNDETLFDSVINLDSTAESCNSREDMTSFATANIAIDSARLRKQTGPRGNNKDRPWSVVGLQCLKKLDFNPLSTSESAIDMIHPHTDTDSSSSSQFLSPSHASTFPLQSAREGTFRRAFSSSDQISPRATKRKLKCSSLPSVTNHHCAKPSSPKECESTEDEIDRTLMYKPTEQIWSNGFVNTASESETSDDYMTAPMDMMTSADEDPHNMSTGSFSENAWDNYQVIYPTASEDATEEVLHWEPSDDLEFDDEFQLTKGSSLLKDVFSKTGAKSKSKISHVRSPSMCDDSDSDMEDFLSVLEDSEMGLKIADHALKKKYGNPMGTGLAVKPNIYVDILSTCETNIFCVENICQHLTSEAIGQNDIKRIKDLIYQWKELHALATERCQQAQQLSYTTEVIAEVKKLQDGAGQYLTLETFKSMEELEAVISELRVRQEKLKAQNPIIKHHKEILESFTQQYPSINFTKYTEELAAVEKSSLLTQEKVDNHFSDLETKWNIWYEYLDGQKELDTLMAADRDRLFALLNQRECGQPVTKNVVLKELETLQKNLSLYEDKLFILQALRSKLKGLATDEVQNAFLVSLADLRNQLQVVSKRCQNLYNNVGDEVNFLGRPHTFGHLAVTPATIQESPSARYTLKELHKYETASAADMQRELSSCCSTAGTTDGRVWSWLRSMPVQIVALMVMAGLVYVLDPDILTGLSNFSITITPELKHVNGPPPI